MVIFTNIDLADGFLCKLKNAKVLDNFGILPKNPFITTNFCPARPKNGESSCSSSSDSDSCDDDDDDNEDQDPERSSNVRRKKSMHILHKLETV